MKFYKLLLLVFITLSCNSSNDRQTNDEIGSNKNSYPELLSKALEAHGGLEKWNSFGTLSFDQINDLEYKNEHHIINLRNRNALIKTDSFSIGMDGKDVWASPSIAATDMNSPRFYHNLFFYFLSIPFVFTDPGVNREDLGLVNLNNSDYRALKITYNEGIGDADNDIYIAYFNKNTFQLEWLLYTVTYYSNEKSEKYNALHYSEYENYNGLKFAKNLKGYKFENDSIGELRYDVKFENFKLYPAQPDPELFKMPKKAEIDSVKTN